MLLDTKIVWLLNKNYGEENASYLFKNKKITVVDYTRQSVERFSPGKLFCFPQKLILLRKIYWNKKKLLIIAFNDTICIGFVSL